MGNRSYVKKFIQTSRIVQKESVVAFRGPRLNSSIGEELEELGKERVIWNGFELLKRGMHIHVLLGVVL